MFVNVKTVRIRKKIRNGTSSSFNLYGKLETYEPSKKEFNIDTRSFDKKIVNASEVNIFHIDSIVKNHINSQISNVRLLEDKLREAISLNKRDEIKVLRRKINDLKSTMEYAYYIIRSQRYINEFKKITQQTSESFLKKETPETEMKKDEIIHNYLLIAGEYVEIENYKHNSRKLMCSECHCTDLRRSTNEDSTFVCNKCGIEVHILDDTPSFKDSNRVNMSKAYTYSRKEHFIEAIKRYQGRQKIDSKVLSGIIEKLKRQMVLHNLIKKEDIEKDHLYLFMSEQSLSKHYGDINLIYHIITGKDCPNISEYEEKLLRDFDVQEKVLERIAEQDDRTNSLNVDYKLHKLLQKNGYKSRKTDFYILKGKEKEDEHDEIMMKVWKILGWSWILT